MCRVVVRQRRDEMIGLVHRQMQWQWKSQPPHRTEVSGRVILHLHREKKESRLSTTAMPRNIEIKARIDGHLDELIERVRSLADGPPQHLSQIDTFFHCPSGGRLKLRVEGVNSPGQLIYYERSDTASLLIPKLSTYSIAPVSHPNELKVSCAVRSLLDELSIDLFSMGLLRSSDVCLDRWN